MKGISNENVRNKDGQTLSEFLSGYKAGDYERPSVTVDMVVLTDEKEVLLIRRANHPNIHSWALPGGFLDMTETLHQAAARELEEETGLVGIEMKGIGIFAEPSRDPRTRVITGAFAALVEHKSLKIAAGDDAEDAKLFSWRTEKLGEIEIPEAKQSASYALRLPCTAGGEALNKSGEGYALYLESADIKISAKLAISDGIAALVDDKMCEEDFSLSGDHALILFAALRSLSQISVS